MFRDAIREFVDHLHAAGVEVVALEEPGMFHVFPILMPWAEGSRRAFHAVGEFVRAHLPSGEGEEPAGQRKGPS
jgi:acetyl esterase/lipase